MTDTEKQQWDDLYQYVKFNILGYDSNQNLPPKVVLKLKGLREGKQMANNHVKATANYTDDVILTAFKICRTKIHSAISGKTFQSEFGKFLYICAIVENEINDVYTRLKNVKISQENTHREYLTNSHHVPVWEQMTIFNKLKIEAPFCKYPTSGCITYVELDSMFVQNIEAVESIINYAFNELDIPYLAFNFPIDSCLDCGYQGEFSSNCSECGSSNIQQLRRVTGYLTTDYHNFNHGKQKEVEQRVKHNPKR